jgi:hypothetical protein
MTNNVKLAKQFTLEQLCIAYGCRWDGESDSDKRQVGKAFNQGKKRSMITDPMLFSPPSSTKQSSLNLNVLKV